MAAIDDALASPTITWLQPKIHADWNNAGYSGDGTIDDMSRQAGAVWSVDQSYDDGLPDDVTDTSGSNASGVFGAGSVVHPGASIQLTAKKYFSPYYAASPVFGLDRDTAGLTVEQGVVASDGAHYTRVFTGQMSGIDMNDDDTASMGGVSKTRTDLMQPVKVPMVNATRSRLQATWVATHALMSCGKYPSPGPGPFSRWWSTFHGSLHPNMASPPYGKAQPDIQYRHYTTNDGVTQIVVDEVDKPHISTDVMFGITPWPTGYTGPFVNSMFGSQTNNDVFEIFQRFYPSQGWMPAYPNRSGVGPNSSGLGWSDLLSQANSRGRISGWYFAKVLTSVPWFVSQVTPKHLLFQTTVQNNTTGTVYGLIESGLDNSTGKFYVRLADNSGNDGVLFWPNAMPGDNQWHFVSFEWDWAFGSAAITVDGLQFSQAFMSLDNTDLPLTERTAIANGLDVGCFFVSRVPVADWSLECDSSFGTGNIPLTTFSMPSRKTLWDFGVTAGTLPSAIVREIPYELEATIEPTARAAWNILTDISQGTLSAQRCDELDRYNIWPQSYFGETAQLTPTETVTTDTNAADLGVVIDPTKIRNVITVQFADTRVSSAPKPVYQTTTAQAIPRGLTRVTYPLEGLQADTLDNIQAINLTATNIAAGTGQSVTRHFVSVNSSSAGTGTYYTASQVGVSVVAVDCNSVTVQFNNRVNRTVFLANNGSGTPFLSISGYPITQADGYLTVRDQDSVNKRGERSYQPSLPYNQSRGAAGLAANQLVAWLSNPHGEVTVTVVGDPRRVPGMSVTLTDPTGTNVGGRWRITAIKHNRSLASYTQVLSLIEMKPQGNWDTAKWDQVQWKA